MNEMKDQKEKDFDCQCIEIRYADLLSMVIAIIGIMLQNKRQGVVLLLGTFDQRSRTNHQS